MAMLTCAAHEQCDDSSGPAKCTCAVGYSSASAGAPCAFSGGPLDPTFQNMPTAEWKNVGATTIDPTGMIGTGQLDLGYGDMDHASICTTHGKIHQSFDMPSVALAEPPQLKLSAALNCTYCGEDDQSGGQLAVGFGEGFALASLSYSLQMFTEIDVCLGERAYGTGVDLSFSSAYQDSQSIFCSDTAFELYIDHASIEPSTTCPAAGTVLNGNFEATGGWTAQGMASVKPNVGVGGSTAGQLVQMVSGDYAFLSGTMSSPYQSLPQAALTFTYNGTNGLTMNAMIGSQGAVDTATVTGTSTFETATICVPEWAKGIPNVLSFELANPGPTTGGSNFVVDNITFSTDTRCPMVANIIDGGFERTDPGSGWAIYSDNAEYGYTEYTTASANVHGGTQALDISLDGPCAYPSAETTVTIPDPVGTAGPAVKFWYKTDPYANGAEFSAYVGEQSVSLPAVSVWTQQTLCLDPWQPGRGANLELQGSNSVGGTCATYFNAVNGYFDDVTVTTDATCPAQ